MDYPSLFLVYLYSYMCFYKLSDNVDTATSKLKLQPGHISFLLWRPFIVLLKLTAILWLIMQTTIQELHLKRPQYFLLKCILSIFCIEYAESSLRSVMCVVWDYTNMCCCKSPVPMCSSNTRKHLICQECGICSIARAAHFLNTDDRGPTIHPQQCAYK